MRLRTATSITPEGLPFENRKESRDAASRASRGLCKCLISLKIAF
jgi:hypothetical protein